VDLFDNGAMRIHNDRKEMAIAGGRLFSGWDWAYWDRQISLRILC